MRFCALLFAGALTVLAADAPMDILEAAKKGNAKEIEALLAKGADLEARDKEGRTPLMLAAQYGRTASVRLLLDKGAKPDARDRHRWNAYMLALLAPAGGVIHTTHEAVLKLLRSEEHTSELQSLRHLVCRLLLAKKIKDLFPADDTAPTRWRERGGRRSGPP